MTCLTARCFDDDGHAAGGGVPEELAERFDTDRAGADRLMPVAARPEWIARVVCVHQLQPATADRPDQAAQDGP